MNLFDTRQASGEGAKNAGRSVREQQTQDGSQEGKDECFGQQLGDYRSARSAQGKADGDFVLALGGAGEKQGDYVGAGDNKKESHRTEQEPERFARAGNGEFFERLDGDGEIRVRLRELTAQLRLEGGEVGTSLLQR